jgi:hypothetical protein
LFALGGKLMAVPVKAGATFEAGVPVALFDTHDPGTDDWLAITWLPTGNENQIRWYLYFTQRSGYRVNRMHAHFLDSSYLSANDV